MQNTKKSTENRESLLQLRSTPNGMNKSDVCILYIFLGHISYIEIFNFMESQPVFSSTISAHGKVKKSCLQKNKPSKQTKKL